MPLDIKAAGAAIFGIFAIFLLIGVFIAGVAYMNGIINDGAGFLAAKQNTSQPLNQTMQGFNTISANQPMIGGVLVLFILLMLGLVIYGAFKGGGGDSGMGGPPIQ